MERVVVTNWIKTDTILPPDASLKFYSRKSNSRQQVITLRKLKEDTERERKRGKEGKREEEERERETE